MIRYGILRKALTRCKPFIERRTWAGVMKMVGNLPQYSTSNLSVKSPEMAAAVFVLLVFGVIQLSSAQTEDPMKMVERVMRTCRDRYKIQTSEIENAIKNKKLPMGERGRGFLLCIIKEVGFNQLKNMIRASTRGKLTGEMASLVELPEFEKELEETSLHMAIAK